MVPVMYWHVRPRLILGVILSFNFLRLWLLIFRLFFLYLLQATCLVFRYKLFVIWFRIVITIEVSLVDKDLAKILDTECLVVDHQGFHSEIIQAQWCFSITLNVLNNCFLDSVGILFFLIFLILDTLMLLIC